MNGATLDLDFKHARRSSRFGLLLLLAGVTGGAIAVGQYHSAKDQLALQQQALERTERAAKPKHAVPLPAADPQYLNVVLDRLNLPWERFFDAIETTAGDDATLIAIVPDTAKGTVQIRGEARNISVVLQYVGKLEGGGFFRNVELVEHERVTQNAELPLRFLVTARWTPTQEKR